LFILDEVITGFRLAPGGAQAYFNVEADLTTLGKILGGGFPIGCVGGREEVMRLADPRDWQAGLKRKSETVWIGGGTFSANPMTMTAGIETLKILRRKKGIYENIRRKGTEVRKGLQEIFDENGMPVAVKGIQSCFEPKLTSLNRKQRVEWLIRLHNKGVFGHMPGGYVSAVHTDKDISKYLDATRETAEEIKN
jgi:glutamate-1-semialdehyde 2,1-aminomutase